MKMPLHLSTVLVRSASSLQSHVANLARTFGNHNHTFLFALSTNIAQSSDLSSLVQSLTNSIEGNTIGCLSRSVRQDAISCSFAIFDSERTTTFRSVIPGKVEPQVGRWHSFRDKDTESVPERTFEEGAAWADVWDGSSGQNALPTELKHLRSSDVDTVLYLSDLAPEGLSNSLKAFPNATKLGLIAGSTPFITGRPVTLFHNREIYSSGAVGIALKNNITVDAQVVFEGAHPVSAPLRITSCDGNMVNTLNGSNPTQLLLSAMKNSGIGIALSGTFKEDEQFSLGVLDSAGKISQIYRITAGDPSRGSISLDSQRAPSVGTVVRFFHHPKSSLSITLESYKTLSKSTCRTLGFLTTSDDPVMTKYDGEDCVLHDTFLAASENGFILGRSAEESWFCSIPGGAGLLQWGPKSTSK